jgi:hypothetical protein
MIIHHYVYKRPNFQINSVVKVQCSGVVTMWSSRQKQNVSTATSLLAFCFVQLITPRLLLLLVIRVITLAVMIHIRPDSTVVFYTRSILSSVRTPTGLHIVLVIQTLFTLGVIITI